jgi:hypothetical protein
LRTCCIPRQSRGAAAAEEERRIRRTWATLAEVADDRPAGACPDRHDPLLGALAHDLDRAVRPQIAETDPGRFRNTKAGVKKEQQDGPVAHAGEPEKASEGVVGDWLDELVGDTRLAQRAERAGFGELLGLEPVPKHFQRSDVNRPR